MIPLPFESRSRSLYLNHDPPSRRKGYRCFSSLTPSPTPLASFNSKANGQAFPNSPPVSPKAWTIDLRHTLFTTQALTSYSLLRRGLTVNNVISFMLVRKSRHRWGRKDFQQIGEEREPFLCGGSALREEDCQGRAASSPLFS